MLVLQSVFSVCIDVEQPKRMLCDVFVGILVSEKGNMLMFYFFEQVFSGVGGGRDGQSTMSFFQYQPTSVWDSKTPEALDFCQRTMYPAVGGRLEIG